MKLLFSVDKNPLGSYNDPLFQSCCKHPLNLDKFNLCVKTALKLSIVFYYAPAGMD